MTIYTRKGDEGYTHRFGGRRVRKSDALICAVGAVDELNSHLGLCEQAAEASSLTFITDALAPVQRELLAAGALLAATGAEGPPRAALEESAVQRMERQIDAVWARLPELTHFIIPRGCQTACLLHVARAVCRRAERDICAAAEAGLAVPAVLLRYVNRLSDLLFALARQANADAALADSIWNPRGPS